MHNNVVIWGDLTPCKKKSESDTEGKRKKKIKHISCWDATECPRLHFYSQQLVSVRLVCYQSDNVQSEQDLRTHVNRSYFVCIFRVIKVEIFCSVNKEMLLILLPQKNCRSLQFVDTWCPPLLAVTFTVGQLAELMPIPAATWTKKHYLCAAAPRHQEIIHLWKYRFLLFHLPLSIFFFFFLVLISLPIQLSSSIRRTALILEVSNTKDPI